MDIVLIKDYSIHKKDALLKNINYTAATELVRAKVARKATLDDLALGKNAKVSKPKQSKKETVK